MSHHNTWNLEAYDHQHPESRHAPNIHDDIRAGKVSTEGEELGAFDE